MSLRVALSNIQPSFFITADTAALLFIDETMCKNNDKINSLHIFTHLEIYSDLTLAATVVCPPLGEV